MVETLVNNLNRMIPIVLNDDQVSYQVAVRSSHRIVDIYLEKDSKVSIVSISMADLEQSKMRPYLFLVEKIKKAYKSLNIYFSEEPKPEKPTRLITLEN